MRILPAIAILTLASVLQTPPVRAIDPVGTWNVSTTTERGEPLTATLTIAGRPGHYTGDLVTSLNERAQLVDVMTSPTGMLVVLEFPGDRLLVTRLLRQQNGTLSGIWGELGARFAITVTPGPPGD